MNKWQTSVLPRSVHGCIIIEQFRLDDRTLYEGLGEDRLPKA